MARTLIVLARVCHNFLQLRQSDSSTTAIWELHGSDTDRPGQGVS
jgi:hypothetical protein